MSITAKELAKIMGLSEAAISMALNNKPGVSTKTRKRVIDKAKELGYDFSRIEEQTEPVAYNGTIYFIIYKKNGAIVGDTPFFSQLSEGIDIGCKETHFYLNVSYLYEGDDVQFQLSEMIRLGCKGIILLGTEMSESDFAPFSNLRIPVVVLDTYFENTSANYVLIDNVQGAYQAASYLIQKCKCQPGYLQSTYSISNFLGRADGFYKAVRRNGMSTSKSIVHRLSPSMEGAYADMADLLHQGEEPARCYFADNDLIAAGAIKAFKEAGYRIPEDIAVVGFDNMPLSTYIDPTLTTIHVPKQYMGMMAARRLADLLTSKTANPIKIEIATTLIVRKSV